MNIQLKTVFGDIIIEGDFSSIAEAVKEALKAGKSLSSANLRSADLRSANLSYANLSYANLSYADLRYADLRYANLRSADLNYANLRYANLSYANLSYANLSYANLSSADLSYANLRYANLSYANLSYANLRYAKNSDYAIACTRILPEGDLIGWKKTVDGVIKLRIPEAAKRSHAFGRKCRAEYVTVLELPKGVKEAHSNYDGGKTIYRKGETVKCDQWCDDFTQECAGGIHFFITKLEAENYSL